MCICIMVVLIVEDFDCDYLSTTSIKKVHREQLK